MSFIYSSDQHAKTERIIRVDGVAQSNAVTELHKRDVQRGNYYHYFSKKSGVTVIIMTFA